MNYYVTIKHPITGDAIQVVCTGKTRTSERGREEAEGKVITPKAGLDTVWFCKEDLCITPIPHLSSNL